MKIKAVLLSVLFSLALTFFSADVNAQKRKSNKPKTERVSSYTKKDGTKVQSYKRSKRS